MEGCRKGLGGYGHPEYRGEVPGTVPVHGIVSPGLVRNGFSGKQVEPAKPYFTFSIRAPSTRSLPSTRTLHGRQPVLEMQRYRIVLYYVRIGRCQEIG